VPPTRITGELLEKEKASTPSSSAPRTSNTPLSRRCHAQTQKRLLPEAAHAHHLRSAPHRGHCRETGVATQIAVGNQASEDTRLLCEWIWAGAIGPVREVPQLSSRPSGRKALIVQEKRKPFLTVSIGISGSVRTGPPLPITLSSFFLAGWPISAAVLLVTWAATVLTRFSGSQAGSAHKRRSQHHDRYPETYPNASMITFNFPARAKCSRQIHLVRRRPASSAPEELEDDVLHHGRRGRQEGLLFVGDKGKILCGFNGAKPRLIPDAKMKAFEPPPKTLPRSPATNANGWTRVKAARTNPAQFRILQSRHGNFVARQCRFANWPKIKWDRANLKVTNSAVADRSFALIAVPAWEL